MSSAGAHPLAKPYHYVVRDTEQNGLCLHNGRLVATRLQGANAAQEGGCPGWGGGGTPTHGCSHPTHPPRLLVEPISVVPNQYLERRRCPLIVGIRGGTQALSCGTGPEPQLKLEEVELLDLFSRGAEATPYTFYKTFGGSTHTFEAAAFPGHFLSTTKGQGEALSLAPPPGRHLLLPRPQVTAAPVGGGGTHGWGCPPHHQSPPGWGNKVMAFVTACGVGFGAGGGGQDQAPWGRIGLSGAGS
uniref:I36RA protein n=1 Tax=Aquila chrysaetos chrysaetos TaxID=223781 RepID=A0A663EPR6_AQUCH